MNFGQLVVVFVSHVWIAQLIRPRRDWVIMTVRILEKKVHGVESEPSHSTLVPKTSDVEHGAFDSRIAPIEIRLANGKVVVIVLSCFGIKLPGRTAKTGDPIVGWNTGRFTIPPDIPVAMR